MKIYVYKDRKTGEIRHVDSFSPQGKTEEEIEAMIEKFNADTKNPNIIETLVLDEKVGLVMSFLLDTKSCKSTIQKAQQIADWESALDDTPRHTLAYVSARMMADWKENQASKAFCLLCQAKELCGCDGDKCELWQSFRNLLNE